MQLVKLIEKNNSICHRYKLLSQYREEQYSEEQKFINVADLIKKKAKGERVDIIGNMKSTYVEKYNKICW